LTQQLSFLSTVMYLTEQNAAAVRSVNRMGWLPLHVAAMHDAPLDMLFYFVREFPDCVM